MYSGGDVDHEVAYVLLVLATPDKLRVQVAVAPLVGHPQRRVRLLLHHRLVLCRGDVGAGVLLVAQDLYRLPGGAAVACSSWPGHGYCSLLLGYERIHYRQPLYLLAVLQVLAVELGAPGFEGCGNDEGIIERETVAALERGWRLGKGQPWG